jgi:hypothetical protein
MQVIAPAFELEEPAHSERLALFWSEVEADPLIVVAVEEFDGNNWVLRGVFSSLDKATASATQFFGPTIVSPRHIDEPDWGNKVVQ